MPEAVATHDQLIKEVFIDPIRTVIAVDDEYPTIDSLIEKEADKNKGWSGNQNDVKRVQDLLQFARSKANPWLVDVHDGKGVTSAAEQKLAPHLQHSDLLVLDYHLDGHTDHGERAIEILRALAGNEHFNLVVVYTKGYEGDFKKVVREIALGLTSNDLEFALSRDDEKLLLEEIDEWEEDNDGISLRLKEEISEDTYLEVRTRFPGKPTGLLGMEEGKRIVGVWSDRKDKHKLVSREKLVKWLLNEKQKSLASQFSTVDFGHVHVGYSEDVNWIRTAKLFVTVLPKETCSPNEFESKLLVALKASNPSPHRLLLTKMRAEIDLRGSTAEAAILGNRHIQTVWLNDFLNQAPVDPKAVVVNTIQRHWEALGDQLREPLNDFAERLHQVFSPFAKTIFETCGLKSSDASSEESLKLYNCYSSTKPMDRSHLTTGHVFSVNLTEETTEYWISLSPACDMVPGQKQRPNFKSSLPFIAVRLHPVSPGVALENANKNIFLFLNLLGKVETFAVLKDGNLAASPDWEQMYAWNGGRFDGENQVHLGSIVEDSGELKTVNYTASVVAQLRSEYALNLLQRIGAFLSRPGLGINFKSRQAA